MDFIYDSDKSKCWYKNTCPLKASGKCDQFCIRHYKMSYLISQSLLGEKDKYPVPLYPDSDGTDKQEFIELKELSKNILDFVKEGKNLFLYSKITGNGKTAWAKKLLLSYFDKIWASSDLDCRGLFIDVQTLFNKLKDNISEENEYATFVRENILKADLVVWDEVGIKNITNYEHDNLLSFLNMRIDAGKANIFTSNLMDADLKNRLGDRLYSRIVLNSKVIEFKGKDKRLLNRW